MNSYKSTSQGVICKFILSIMLTIFIVFHTMHINSVQAFNWFNQSDANEESLSDEDLEYIREVYNAVQQLYVEDVSKDALLEGALKGMVDAIGDPYSEFMDAAQSADLQDEVEGSFTGIGVQFISNNGEITVVSPIDGTPASEAGIQPNDIFLEADGEVLTGMDTNQVVELIRGEIGTTVTILIRRGSSEFEVEIERAEIPIISVTGTIDENYPEVAKIQISQFIGTTYEELVETVKQMKNDGAQAFVFDLRYNPGGLLDQALLISNMFLQDDEIMMYIEESGQDLIAYPASEEEYGSVKIDVPYVILINEGSASASEILAAAIKENTDSPILGTTSFGKGTVQTMLLGSDIGELKLTFAKWLTPSETWVHDEGIEPTQIIESHPVNQAIILDSEQTLAIGMRSDEVKSLSSVLNALGYNVEISDYFDDALQEAVQAFQEDNNLDVTGEVTGETANQVNNAARDYIQENDAQYEEAVEVLLDLVKLDQAA